MKSDTAWETPEQYTNLLLIIQVIQKNILSQTYDMYPFASVYEQERTLYTFHQNELINDQWYKKFKPKYYVANVIGVTRQHKALLDHVSQEKHSANFENTTE